VASPVEAPKKAGGSMLQRLPRLSTSVWLILILCLFLIAMLPMAMDYMGQASKQQALRLQLSQLQLQYDTVKAKMSGKADLSTEMGRLKAEAEAARKLYEEGCDNLKSSQALMDLAWKYDLNITSMTVSASQGTVLGIKYPALTYGLSLTGQVANFQNFLIAVDNRFPASQYLDITITPAVVEGELDIAAVSIQIICNAQ
jgi:hypothetical protein